MKKIKLGRTGMEIPNIAVGCMRISGKSENEVENFIKTAIENGLNFFDHADIYGGGKCEEIFSKAIHMNDDIREKIIIQTKCGITNGMYDFSKQHIHEAVEGSLKRLNTDYIDILLLHRPDALCEPEEVAEVLNELHTSGKVRYFGVSNHNPYQIKLLQKYMTQPIVANQMQFSITNCSMVDVGLNVNNENDRALDRDGNVLDFCRLNDITLQAWSPFQSGFFGGVFIDDPRYKELNEMLGQVADEYNTTKTAIAVSWIARHPAHIQTVTGTTNINRLLECSKGAEIELTRKQWYDLYKSAGKKIL